MSDIKFGTDGWRAVIAEDFTFANVRLLTQAYCRFLSRSHPSKPPRVLVGYDTRFQSERFAATVAEVISANGYDLFLANAAAPTPAIAWGVKHLGVAGAVIITSSHNPAEYNGFKLKAAYAGSAGPELTAQVEQALAEIQRDPAAIKALTRIGAIMHYDPRPPYFEQLSRLVDVERIRNSNLYIVCDPLYGAGQGYVPRLLRLPRNRLRELHGKRDAFFGGLHPEPILPHVDELSRVVVAAPHRNKLGLAFDGDADRLGVVDDRGRFLESQKVLALLVEYLVRQKGWRGEVIKTFSVGRQLDKVCRELGLKLHETPIGFKYICDLMQTRDILLGGEESGGIGIKGHIPERDGSLGGLLVAELVAVAGKPLSAIVADFDRRYGSFVYSRIDLHVEQAKQFVQELAGQVPKQMDGRAVAESSTMDGLKLSFKDGSWLLLRGSGTEPLLRIYAEASHAAEVEGLLQAGRRWAEAAVQRRGRAPGRVAGGR